MSTNYCNANDFLPQELIQHVLGHLPPDRRERVLLYLHPDFYAARDAKLVLAFDRAVAERQYRRRGDLYAALAREFGLSPRRICAILRKRRPESAAASRNRTRCQKHGHVSTLVRSREKGAPAQRAAISLSRSGPRRG